MAEKVAIEFGHRSYAAAEKSIKVPPVEAKVEDFDAKYARKRAEEKHDEAIELANSFI
jgi:hypothetical protein